MCNKTPFIVSPQRLHHSASSTHMPSMHASSYVHLDNSEGRLQDLNMQCDTHPGRVALPCATGIVDHQMTMNYQHVTAWSGSLHSGELDRQTSDRW